MPEIFCCTQFELHAKWECEEHPERIECPEVILHRYKISWGIPIHDGGELSFQPINYCPWCAGTL